MDAARGMSMGGAQIDLSVVDGGGAVVAVAGMMDIPVAMALRRVLLEAAEMRAGALWLRLDIPVNGAELLAQILRDAQARFRAKGRRFVVATPNPAVARLLAGANVAAGARIVLGTKWRAAEKSQRRSARIHPAQAGYRVQLSRCRRQRHRRCGGGRADPRARHPARLEGRLDLPVPERPHSGRRYRRGRSPPVPVPRRVAGHAGRQQARSGAEPGPQVARLQGSGGQGSLRPRA